MGDYTPWMDRFRFVITFSNFILSVVFSIILLLNAFQMNHISGLQVFHTDRVLQSYTHKPGATLDTFIKEAYGTQTNILGIVSDIKVLQSELPAMYEISGSNSILRLEAVHCNFLLFSALWISSAFALAMTQLPFTEPLYWGQLRVIVVHVWNLLGLILTIMLFTGTTKWKDIPTSNLFYALVGQVMAWSYQYFHMVECTQSHVDNYAMILKYQSPYSYGAQNTDPAFGKDPLRFSTELRKLLYMEFSVVAPIFLVTGMLPGAVGKDEWRVQTVLFASWTLFALMGLHLRYRKTLFLTAEDLNILNIRNKEIKTTRTAGEDGQKNTNRYEIQDEGLDAIGYLTYAILMVFVMVVNALGTTSLSAPTYATSSIGWCRMGVLTIVVLMASLVVEILLKTFTMRFMKSNKFGVGETVTNKFKQMFPKKDKNITIPDGGGDAQGDDSGRTLLPERSTRDSQDSGSGRDLSMISEEPLGPKDFEHHEKGQVISYISNLLIIAFGSFLAKCVLFTGIANVNALSSYPM